MNNNIKKSWDKIAPLWPIKNIIAVNPLKGFEDLPFQDALKEAHLYFQQKDIPQSMHTVNRESIKWLQAFFDEGQSKISMPRSSETFLKSIVSLLYFDTRIHKNDSQKITWLKNLPKDSINIINECLTFLAIKKESQELFLTLMLTTLPGWASFIKYQTEWTDNKAITQEEYLAFRLILTSLVWPEAQNLLAWHNKAKENNSTEKFLKTIFKNETEYQSHLIQQLENQTKEKEAASFSAQFLFCIDVRSEPFRKTLEQQGPYQTFGCAGFFGIPVTINNAVKQTSYPSAPVLVNPECTVQQKPSDPSIEKKYKRLQILKKMYQSAKYTFTTPLTLVETLGIVNGMSMMIKTVFPQLAQSIKTILKKDVHTHFTQSIESIPFNKQVEYTLQTLTMMGLTDSFAPLVVVCSHGSTTENNIYESALQCGACAGHSDTPNAQIFAAILNKKDIRGMLRTYNIIIPDTTYFVAAQHNTTTNQVLFYDHRVPEHVKEKIALIKQDLKKVKKDNCTGGLFRSQDWAEVRPEWGLAKNASFIIGPRWLTKNIDLEGRAFLHSYEWEKDEDGSSLAKILTAPVIVAQWINAQYLFSTIDNVAFGGGSKITKNITGKIGVMQGNASDLMMGLPLQSVKETDTQNYHEPVRLTVIAYAPQNYIDDILNQEPKLKQLVDNEWIFIKCLQPKKENKSI